MFPQLAQFTDLSLLLLRLMVAAVFVTSGWDHVKDPKERAKSIGVSPAGSMLLGVGEFARGLGGGLGVLTQLPSYGLFLIMLGSIQKKKFVLRHGFLGKNA